jgi:hypothetical protein
MAIPFVALARPNYAVRGAIIVTALILYRVETAARD